MNFASVIRILSLMCLVVAGLMAFPFVVAVGFGEHPQIISFGMISVLLALVAGSILLLTPKPNRRAMASDGLAVALLGWIVIGVAAAPPFVIGAANSSVLSALHESVSCLTTTGHSVISIGDGGWPKSLLVWRGLLHIIGCIMTLTVAASVFAAINLGGPGIHRTELFTIPDESFFSAVPRVLIAASVFTTSLIAGFVILLVFSGVPGGQALADAISAITTGIVDPAQPQYTSFLRSVVVSIALIFGTLGLYFGLNLRRLDLVGSFYDPEVLALIVALLGFSIIAVIAGMGAWEAGTWSLSAISTSGLQITPDEEAVLLPIPVIILPALIGGAALSAAGGIKLGRLVILVRRAAQEFGSLGYRGSMVKFVYRRRALDESSVIGVWVYLIGYISAIVLFVALLSYSGHSFETAVPTTIGAISNSGALIDLKIANSNLDLAIILAMLLGRWEILALLPIFVPAFWRK